MIDQLNAPSALPQQQKKKQTKKQTNLLVRTLCGRKTLLLLKRIETQVHGHPALCLVTVLTELTTPLYWQDYALKIKTFWLFSDGSARGNRKLRSYTQKRNNYEDVNYSLKHK